MTTDITELAQNHELRNKINHRLYGALEFQGTSGEHATVTLSIDECKSIIAAMDERLALVEALEKAQQVDYELCKLLPPGVEYMDPPDGGSVTPLEQVSRMIVDYRQRIAELESHAVTAAAADVLAERQRQVTTEGWAPAHDDEYEHGELADAAGCYALSSELFDCAGEPPRPWPWPDEWWKPTSRRRDLVKAGALILAEIERIDRAGSGRKGKNQPGMVVAVHIDAGDFVKFRDQVYEVKETDFDDHDVTLWFVCGETLKCAAGCQIEVVTAPEEAE